MTTVDDGQHKIKYVDEKVFDIDISKIDTNIIEAIKYQTYLELIKKGDAVSNILDEKYKTEELYLKEIENSDDDNYKTLDYVANHKYNNHSEKILKACVERDSEVLQYINNDEHLQYVSSIEKWIIKTKN